MDDIDRLVKFVKRAQAAQRAVDAILKRPAMEMMPAPSSPMNLRLGTVYAPRVATPPYIAFKAIEIEPNYFEIYGYEIGGLAKVLSRTASLSVTWQLLSIHLRMDV